ncbi:DotU family type IV/VI secretion system protein [Paracraurococcus ruber]|nr:DotU family type IV/VI secretion system protein [Paracraurococcus ruber]
MPAADGLLLRLPAANLPILEPAGIAGALRFSALLRAMMEFHAALLQARRRLRTEVVADDTPPEVSRARVATVAARLEEILQQQRDQARRLSDRQAALLRDAQYVMCALADDLLLYDDGWELRLLWREELLESRMFGTRIAGERFFDRARRIAGMADRDGPDLAPVYLLALCLGFRGRHRDPGEEPSLREHARALFEAATGRRPDPEMEGRPVAPLALASIQGGQAALRRPRRFGWPLLGAALAAAFLLAGTALWFWQTAPVWRAAAQVFQAAQ